MQILKNLEEEVLSSLLNQMTSQLYCDLILHLNKKMYKASTILDFKKTFQGGGAGRVLEVTCFLHNAHIKVSSYSSRFP